MSRRSIPFSLIGLTLGVLIGIGIVYLKSRILDELIGVLEHEVKGSCNCTLEYDSRSLSFLRLRAAVKNIRIVEHGIPKLQFKELSSTFGFSALKNKKLFLDLTLDNGFADGVGPSSATYRFLDFLTAPTEKSKDPTRWKVKVRTLLLKDSTLYEKVSSGYTLEAHGTSLKMVRDELNEFEMYPSIEELRLVPSPDKGGETPIPISIGGLSASFHLGDLAITIYKAQLSKLKSGLNLHGVVTQTLPNTPLQLASKLHLDLPSLSSLFSSGAIEASGTIFGTAKDTQAIGTIALQSPIHWSNNQPEHFNVITGKYQLNNKTFSIPEFTASGLHTELKVTKPLSISPNLLSGALSLSMKTLALGSTIFNGVTFSARLAGDIDSPQLLYQANSDDVSFGASPLYLPSLSIAGALTPSSVNCTVNTIDEKILDLTYGLGPKAATKISFNAKKLPITTKYFLSGSASGEGSISDPRFTISGKLTLLSANEQPLMSSEVTINRNELLLTGGNQNKSFRGTLHTTFTSPPESTFDAQFLNFSGFIPPQHESCMAVDGDIHITSSTTNNGTLRLTKAHLGCSDSQLILAQPTSITLSNDVITIPTIAMSGSAGKFSISGTLLPMGDSSLLIEGSSEVSPFSSLIPSVDGISGSITAHLRGHGPRSNLTFTGGINITDGGLSSESLGLTAESIHGSVNLDNGGTISLTGRLNGGHVQLEGALDSPTSPLRATLKSVMLTPTPESTLETSAILTLSNLKANTPPLISGSLNIDNGLYSKNIDIAQIVQELVLAITQLKEPKQRELNTSSGAPQLDLHISIPGNLFISTNIGDAELIGNLHVTGTPQTPEINGTVETLSGSFAIKENRFEIISAKLSFVPQHQQPLISLLASTSARSPSGELVQVMIDAQGPIDNPKIAFSSDRPMSEQELLTIVAFGQRTMDRTGSMPLTQSKIEFIKLDEDEESVWSALVSKLTRIDALNFEPQYNIRSGLIEPRVLVRKDITRTLALIGESNFGGTETYRKLKLLYGVTPEINITTYAEETGGRRNSAIGADVVWTILKENFLNTTIIINGLPSAIKRQELIQAMKLYENVKVTPTSISRIESLGRDYIKQQGYLDAQLNIVCTQEDEPTCSQLTISINSGVRATIESVQFIGDKLPIDLTSMTDSLVGQEASIKISQEFSHRIIRQLRLLGYYSARASTNITPAQSSKTSGAIVQFNITTGRKIVFTFSGNSAFKDQEFLEPLELIKRKFPFGPNSISSLLDTIKQMYINENYIGTEITSSRTITNEGAIKIAVSINEGLQVKLKRPRVVGLHSISKRELLNGFESSTTTPAPFDCRTLDPSILNRSAAITQSILNEHGYPEASVSWKIEVFSEDEARIVFTVVEGPQHQIAEVAVKGHTLAKALVLPAPLHSITTTLDKEIALLHEQGYAQAHYQLSLDSPTSAIAQFTLGLLSHIGDIQIVGASPNHEKLIRSKLTFTTGDAWNSLTLNSMQRKLLSLGLFSRVTFAPLDGTINDSSETLVITVKERSGETLEIGAGANSEFGAHLFAEAVDRAYFDDGRTISLRLDAYYDPSESNISQGISELRYVIPEISNSSWSLAEAVRYQRLDLTTYEFDLDRIALSSTLLRSSNNGLLTSISHTISNESLDQVSPGAIIGEYDSGSVRLGFLSGLFRFESLDDPVNPSRGYSLTLDSKVAAPPLGSEASFASAGTRLITLTPFGKSRFGLAINIGAQMANSFGSTDEIPISQRYYLGGRTSIRGYRENSLGPRGKDGAIIGGDRSVYSTIELRYRLLDKVSVHTFLDAGNVYLRSGNDPFEIEKAVGLGFNYISPIGPVGFDVGHPLGDRDGQKSLRFHFMIGRGF